MLIGVPKEVKDHEARVGIVPSGVKGLIDAGHKVIVETNAGALSSMPDEEYKAAGAEIAGSAAEVWSKADMVVKVKEPISQEVPFFRDGLVLFTYVTTHFLNHAIGLVSLEALEDSRIWFPNKIT